MSSLHRVNLHPTSRVPSLARNHAASMGSFLIRELTFARITGMGLVAYGVSSPDLFGLASILLGTGLIYLSFVPKRSEQRVE